MPYPAILSRRMPYDIDGTEIALGSSINGIVRWESQENKAIYNNHDLFNYPSATNASGLLRAWVWFPEKREITHIFCKLGSGTEEDRLLLALRGSNDTANGMDGTWENASLSEGVPSTVDTFSWRSGIKPVSFSGTKKVIMLEWNNTSWGSIFMYVLHLYGSKAAGETPDDILFLKDGVNEFTALKDWGDRPESTVDFSSFRVKNASASKSAKNVNIQLNHEDFAISWNEGGPWVTFVDIASLGPGQVSSPIYVRNLLGPPLLILGPKAARVIANVGSWE